MLEFAPHPLLYPVALHARYPAPMGEIEAAPELAALHQPDADVPGAVRLTDDEREVLRQSVRDLLRHGGHKPTGRGKPSSEYLVRAAGEKGLPTINAAVDVCNAVSLHSGLPISVVDVQRATPPFRVAVPETGSYVFNQSGQEIRLDGLLCIYDANGPIANSVKDSHGTKTSPETVETLSVIWAPVSHREHADAAADWYGGLLSQFGGARVMHHGGQ